MEEKKRTGAWALVAKLGGKFLSLLVKSSKLLKVGLAAATFASYTWFFTWKFAILLMIAIGFHEASHVLAMKRLGIRTRGWFFLPFLGGVAVAEEGYISYWENAYVAIAGPVGGAILAWATMFVYWATGNPMWAAGAAFQAVLNIFNLLPISPLDGGQMVRSITFSINKWLGAFFLLLSFIAAMFIMFKLRIGLFGLLLIVGGIEVFIEWRYRIRMLNPNIPKWMIPPHVLNHKYPRSMNKKELALASFLYVGTIAVLVAIILLTKKIAGADLAAQFLE